MPPVVVELSINNGLPVRSVATDFRDGSVHIALMQWAAELLVSDGNFVPNAKASVVFHSAPHGESPEINGIVRHVNVSEDGAAAVSVEILDWDQLAKFWRGVHERAVLASRVERNDDLD